MRVVTKKDSDSTPVKGGTMTDLGMYPYVHLFLIQLTLRLNLIAPPPKSQHWLSQKFNCLNKCVESTFTSKLSSVCVQHS